MKILFIADARSPIAQAWICYFIARGYEVHVISTYPCAPASLPGARLYQCPIAFSNLLETAADGTTNGTAKSASRAGAKPSWFKAKLARLRRGQLGGLILAARSWAGPIELQRHVQTARELTTRIAPDLVHAMRIPFEGMLAAKSTPQRFPLLVSIWGNDLTLFAKRYPLVARQTKEVLRRADALHSDCDRDLKLAMHAWGFQTAKPHLALPSSGGIQSSLFHTGTPDLSLRQQLNIADDAPIVINPRGARGYVRNDVFFQAIPAVLRAQPQTIFLCSAMQGNAMAEKWISKLQLQANVRLLPAVPRDEMAEMFRLAAVAVSPSLHDGTPNTLLEAMASGCLPVAGDIESVREWIVDEVNGLLCDPTRPDDLARAMIRALEDERLQNAARAQNLRLIAERAEYNQVMQQAEAFYAEIIDRHKRAATV